MLFFSKWITSSYVFSDYFKKFYIFLILGLVMVNCETPNKQFTEKADLEEKAELKKGDEKIKVLNFATFHMGATSDARKVEFDKENKKNQQDAKQIASLISQFKPTVICVEVPLEKNEQLNKKYADYLRSEEVSTYYGEVGLVAFQVAKMNNIDTLYGIDHKLSYNYNIHEMVKNAIDSVTYNNFKSDPFRSIPDLNIFEEGLSLMEKLSRMNHPKFLDFLIHINADILAFVGSEEGYEGADEAAKYYQRNLRIYANLNRLPLKTDDRVFILSGGSHTAFLNQFMKRSTKYEVVDTFDYLK